VGRCRISHRAPGLEAPPRTSRPCWINLQPHEAACCIDEITASTGWAEDLLYPAWRRTTPLILRRGRAANRPHPLGCLWRPFHLVGATTRAAPLAPPLRDALFRPDQRLEFYGLRRSPGDRGARAAGPLASIWSWERRGRREVARPLPRHAALIGQSPCCGGCRDVGQRARHTAASGRPWWPKTLQPASGSTTGA